MYVIRKTAKKGKTDKGGIGRREELRERVDKGMLGLVYREFSRQMYNKYKHQHLNMRES